MDELQRLEEKVNRVTAELENAQEISNKLEQLEFKSSSTDRNVTVTVDGNGSLKSVDITRIAQTRYDGNMLDRAIVDTTHAAVRKSQEFYRNEVEGKGAELREIDRIFARAMRR